MKKGHRLSFGCIACETPIEFSVLHLEEKMSPVTCSCCHKSYCFSDALAHQMKLFEGLCYHIYEARDLLGKSCVAIDLQDRQIKVPFNILLTRLTSELELEIEGKKIALIFRVDPISDVKKILTD